jgi:hypothetical protein
LLRIKDNLRTVAQNLRRIQVDVFVH